MGRYSNSFKTSLIFLGVGGAIALFFAVQQILKLTPSKSYPNFLSKIIDKNDRVDNRHKRKNDRSAAAKQTNSTPTTKPRKEDKQTQNLSSLNWILNWTFSFDSPFPLVGLLIQNSSTFRPHILEEVSPITPVLSIAIASISSRLVVDLSDAKVYSYWGNKRIASYPVAIGQTGWETPTGSFKVVKKIRNPVWIQPITEKHIPTGPDNPLGDRWIGFWADERHQIGFHGTNDEKLVGKAISHGCLRMRNHDIRALYNQVTLGTPVIVRE